MVSLQGFREPRFQAKKYSEKRLLNYKVYVADQMPKNWQKDQINLGYNKLA